MLPWEPPHRYKRQDCLSRGGGAMYSDTTGLNDLFSVCAGGLGGARIRREEKVVQKVNIKS